MNETTSVEEENEINQGFLSESVAYGYLTFSGNACIRICRSKIIYVELNSTNDEFAMQQIKKSREVRNEIGRILQALSSLLPYL